MTDSLDTIPIVASGSAPIVDQHARIVDPDAFERANKEARRALVNADRTRLAEQYPAAFAPAGAKTNKKPLKIGIHRDVIAAGLLDERGERISGKRIRRAVDDYCSGPRYARGILSHNHRIDLDGRPVEPVNSHARKHAQDSLDQRERKNRRNLENRARRAAEREAMADA